MSVQMNCLPQSSPSTQATDLDADIEDRAQYEYELSRVKRIYERRKVFYQHEDRQKQKSTARLFILSTNNDPWQIFGFSSWLEYRRRTYECSGLHFSRLHEACAIGDKKSVQRLLELAESERHVTGCSTLALDSSGRIPLHQAVVREHHEVIRLLMKQNNARLQLHVGDNRGAPPVQYVLEKMHRLALKEPAETSLPIRATRLRVTSRRFQKLWKLANQMLQSMVPKLVHELKWLDCMVRGDAWDAVHSGDVKRLRNIHNLYGNGVSQDLNELGYSLLHAACSDIHHDLKVVLFLITEMRLDRSKKTASGLTPLHCAAGRGWFEACMLLLDEDVPEAPIEVDELLMATDACNRTPLHACLYSLGLGCSATAGSRSNTLMTARYLVQRCPETLHVIDNDGFSPLHYAICCGDHALVELMIALGANLFHDIHEVQPRSEYGVKASWAPCGAQLQRNRPQRRGDCATKSDNEPNEVDTVRNEEPPTASPTVHSIACDRMRRVKAGQVEHPGQAIPMETLWFLVRNSSEKCVVHRQADVTVNQSDSKRAKAVLEAPNGSCEDDSNRIGCRRFGALCANCQPTTGKDGMSLDYSSRKFGHREVAMSVLTLANRCCRLDVHDCLDERIAIVETLLLAGSPVDDSVINETLYCPQTPRLIELVFTHSGEMPTRDHIIDHFFPVIDEPIDELDPLQSILLSLLETNPDLFDHTLLPSLFRWGYFSAVDRIVGHGYSSGDIEILIREMCRTPQLSTRSRKLKQPPAITTRHLKHVMRWVEERLVRSVPFMILGCKCVEELLTIPRCRTNRHRKPTDELIASSVAIFCQHWMLNDDVKIVNWMCKAIDNGFIVTARALWVVIKAIPAFVTGLVCALNWPIRLPNLHVDFTENFVHEMVKTILTTVSLEVAEFGLIAKCFAIACIYKLPIATVKVFFARFKPHDQETCIREILVSRRFGGHTLPHWIAINDQVDMAEYVLSALDAQLCEVFWFAITSAVLATSPLSSDKWQALLFRESAASSETAKRQCWLSKRLVRVDQRSCYLPAAVDWLSKSLYCDQEWFENSMLVQDIARWNGLGLMRQLIAGSVGCQAACVVLSRLVTRHDDVDACTPLDICKQLGFAELARLMRSLISDDSAQQIRQECEESNGKSHFGLFHTYLSMPLTDTQQPTCSLKQVFITQRSAFSCDWKLAVVRNDVRLLEAFELHEIPITISTEESEGVGGDTIVALLKVAIDHSSLDAVRWLLSHKVKANTNPKNQELILKAARHTSLLHAQMTLALLQHPAFDPGRLSGDGDRATLLHRAACFSDTEAASSILKSLLAIEGSDVNVRDGFGCTPIAYALASGCLSNASFLLEHNANVRLEAEFEGQTAFYYTLQLAPSFSWRWILQTLLITKRHAAFLHCTNDDCACRGFEMTTVDATDGKNVICSFCGHALDLHTHVPFPPWFRDQYETYLDVHTHINRHNHDSEGDGDDGGDKDPEIRIRHRLRAMDETAMIEEATIEHECGRLDTTALEGITHLRFGDLLTSHALVLSSRTHVEVASNTEDYPKLSTFDAESTGLNIPDSAANLTDTSATEVRFDSLKNALSSPIGQFPHFPPRPTSRRLQRSVFSPIFLSLLPWFLRGDVAMVLHDNDGFNAQDYTTTNGRIHAVVQMWLRSTSARTQSDRAPSTLLAAAFAQWREVTMRATSTCVSFHGRGTSPVALDASNPVPRLVAAAWEEPTSGSSSSASVTATSTMPPPSAIGRFGTNKSLSILQLFLHHWQYAHVYQCFRLWKRRCHNVNAQVALHEIEVLSDSWAADTRRTRLNELLVRQLELEQKARQVLKEG